MRAAFPLLAVLACNGRSDTTDVTDTTETSDTGVVGTGVDGDNDGYTVEGGDCNDADPSIHPGAAEVACDNIDNDCNGQVDDGVAGWQQTQHDRDSNGDAKVDSTKTNAYRTDGQPLSEEQTYVDPGASSFEYLIEWSYTQDRVTEMVRTGQNPQDVSYQTDDEGRVTRAETDIGSDDNIDQIVEYEYDELDRVVLQRNDSDGDGKWDSISAYLFDGLHSVGWRTDTDADGTWDRQAEQTRDADGTVTSRRSDTDDDPEWDNITTYLFDTDGFLVGLEQDQDGDGKIDHVETYTNNEEGLLTRGEEDAGNDNVLDRIWERDYDKAGNQSFERQDRDADGKWDTIFETYDYTSEGRPERARSDDDADGKWDRQWWYTYDGILQTSLQYDSNGDDTPENVFEWAYDKAGNLEHDRYDLANDGTWDQENWYTWQCGAR